MNGTAPAFVDCCETEKKYFELKQTLSKQKVAGLLE